MKRSTLTARKPSGLLYHFLFLLVVGISIAGVFSVAMTAHAAPITNFNPGRIIDDDIFALSNSMGISNIQAFLNSKVQSCDTWGTQTSEFGGGTRAQWAAAHGYSAPFTCLRDYSENGLSSAQIIFNAAQQYGINPQVLIVLLQKEQGLVTDTWPISTQYRSATGYGCPDNSVCDSQYYGLTNQVNWSAKMFRAILNASPTWYTPYIMGNNYIRWNPNASCGGSTVNITTRATQALYNYTPYQPNQAALNAGYANGDSCSSYGNRNFFLYFTDWFGSTYGNSYYTCRYGSNIPGVASGEKLLSNNFSTLSLVVSNNTSTACAEVHTWASNTQLQIWSQHTGTNSYTFDPAYSTIISDKVGGGATRFDKVDYRNTNSGHLEVHGWDASEQQWISHVATVSGPLDPTTSDVVAADTNGDGVSELYIVNYANTGSGMVEIHGLSPNLQQWTRHTATNLPAIDPTKGKVIAADVNGDGKDEFVYIKYGDAQSGRVEVHVWAPDLQQWTRHTATNLPSAGFNRLTDDIISGNAGNGPNELLYVKYAGTQSGRVEVHGWTGDEQQWLSHIATSAGSF